jgi:hypothetical protein
LLRSFGTRRTMRPHVSGSRVPKLPTLLSGAVPQAKVHYLKKKPCLCKARCAICATLTGRFTNCALQAAHSLERPGRSAMFPGGSERSAICATLRNRRQQETMRPHAVSGLTVSWFHGSLRKLLRNLEPSVPWFHFFHLKRKNSHVYNAREI